MSIQIQFTVVIIIIATYLRKNLKNTPDYPLWNKWLQILIYISAGLISVPYIIEGSGPWISAVSAIILGLLLYSLYKNPILRPFRFILIAVAPYFIVSFIANGIELINEDFYHRWRSYFGNAKSFAVLWMIGVWVVNNRQQRELEKSKKKVEEEQRKSALISSMKDELEVQVQARTIELTRQKEELEVALAELKATQAQLIQSEKMASLGELTAGIAHEIQNPLNFVNNFSEVSNEMVEELKSERLKQSSERDETLEEEILNDLIANLQKINHHGKRADAIVKGMLEHSRASKGDKQPADINALADEYLRLAYHGLRAKDKSFNVHFSTAFDESIGKIGVVPQDMGRVLLNLYNNAFYAVSERKKSSNATYAPTVLVTTRKIDDEIIISIKDNGTGIPQDVIDKIYQPFFTTKPTGQGTGLGLSLSYDIVKAHGGEISVESKENEGTEFIINLPATQI